MISPALADKKDKILDLSFRASSIFGWGDYSTSLYLYHKKGYYESNPFGSYFIKNPHVGIPYQLAMDYGLKVFIREIVYKQNKTFGIILSSIVAAVKGYFFFRNIGEIL